MSSSSINGGKSTITSIICYFIIVDEKGEIHSLITTGVQPTFPEDKSKPKLTPELHKNILKLYKDVNYDDLPPTKDKDTARQSNLDEADYHTHSPAESRDTTRSSRSY